MAREGQTFALAAPRVNEHGREKRKIVPYFGVTLRYDEADLSGSISLNIFAKPLRPIGMVTLCLNKLLKGKTRFHDPSRPLAGTRKNYPSKNTLKMEHFFTIL